MLEYSKHILKQTRILKESYRRGKIKSRKWKELEHVTVLLVNNKQATSEPTETNAL